MPEIHPTAVVDRNAELADDVRIGPYTIIGSKVAIDRGTTVGAHSVIENRTHLGKFNRIGHHACVGGVPQDLKYQSEDTALRIGDHNEIRENATLHIGTANGGGETTIGSHNLLMVNAHVAHDCHIGDHAILSNNTMLAGHIDIHDYAVLAGGAAVSHYVTIGRYAFVGGLAGVVHDAPPFMVSDGHPARVRGVNNVALHRHGFEAETVQRLRRAFNILWSRRGQTRSGSLAAALEQAEAELGDDPHAMELITFARRIINAPNGRYAEAFRRDDKRSTPTQ